MQPGTRTDADYSLIDADALAPVLDTDPGLGLTSAEAARRLAEDGPNEIRARERTPLWRRIVSQFSAPLVHLLLVAMVISGVAWYVEGAVGAPIDVIVIAVIVIVNAVIGLVQEGRAENAVAALARMTAASSTVMRDGRLLTIPAAELVRGDVLILAEGDSVGADARLVSAAGLKIQEASLTGESVPVVKDPATLTEPTGIGDRTNCVFKGTGVVHGTGRAIVTATGMNTQMGYIARMLDAAKDKASPLDREVERLTKILGSIVLAIAIVVMVVLVLINRPDSLDEGVDILLVGVSLAVAAVPEGLPAILSMLLAIGVQTLASRNAVMKSLHSVETLGAASVICSDKTGTLTRNEMTIRVVLTPSGRIELSGTGYSPDGHVEDDPGERVLSEAALVIAGGSIANNADLSRGDDGTWTVTGDPTEGAFLVAQHKLEGARPHVEGAVREAEVPFDSERKLMSVLAVHAEAGWRLLLTKGAPDVLVPKCRAERVDGEVVPLDEERRAAITRDVDDLASRGYRTLAVAYKPTEEDAARLDESDEDEMILYGVVGIIDPARPEAKDAVVAAKRAGIRIVMITGDHPVTAVRIAGDLGIIGEGGRALTGADLDALGEDAFAAVVRDISVYARVAPEHKLRIVSALQAGGEVVAMTGDGVNDAPALKTADIGVSMGITGTEVSKEAATMILADDDFATIVSAVHRGRIVFSNIRKFMRYLLSSNIGEVVTVFFGIVFAGALGLSDAAGAKSLGVPLLAAQILWINLITDSGPALAMGVDPEDGDLMAGPPRHANERIVTRVMWARILATGVVMGAVSLAVLDAFLPGGLIDWGEESVTLARTATFTTLVFAQLFNALNARSETESVFTGLFDNGWLWASIVFAAIAQIVVVHVPTLQVAFGTAALTPTQWAVCTVAASFVLWAEEAVKAVRRARLRAVATSSPAVRATRRA